MPVLTHVRPGVDGTAMTPIADPWQELVYPLTLQEIQRLSWLQAKISAVEWLANHDHQATVDFLQAKRLAFVKWMVLTGRLRG
jgi:hypothetical protein